MVDFAVLLERHRAAKIALRCAHRLVVDEEDWSHVDEGSGPGWPRVWRLCLTCGESYDRSALLADLQRVIRDRYRLPRSPWSAEERSADTW